MTLEEFYKVAKDFVNQAGGIRALCNFSRNKGDDAHVTVDFGDHVLAIGYSTEKSYVLGMEKEDYENLTIDAHTDADRGEFDTHAEEACKRMFIIREDEGGNLYREANNDAD
jgi:hypothetical protein